MRNIDILKKANAKEPLRVEIELPGITCYLHAPNRHQIISVQEKLYRMAYAEACDLGLVGKPVNESEYERSKGLVNTLGHGKPFDLAEQYAQFQSVSQVVYNLIPGLLRDKDGAEIFPTIEEKREFLDLLKSDLALETLVIGKWADLFKIKDEVVTEAKNE